MEKLILALVMATRKLRPYFQSFRAVYKMEYPLTPILHNLDASSRVTKWAIELGQHKIIYRHMTSIKAQALADFVAKFTLVAQSTKEETSSQIPPKNSRLWKLYVDELSNIHGAGVRMVMQTLEGSIIKQALKLGFKAINNEVDYKALIARLKVMKELNVNDLVIHCDLMLIVNQVTGDYTAYHPYHETLPKQG